MSLNHSRFLFTCLLVLFVAPGVLAQRGKDPGGQAAYYHPYTNEPPGPPPNYNLVDPSYFQGVPSLPIILGKNAGGYYIYNDSAQGKW
ncbi:MAG: hypothetical protein ACE5FH_09230, partial [Candidatus Zixiibacteriota bacterium]